MILSAVRGELAVSWNGDMLTVLPTSQRDTIEELVDGDFVGNLREAGFTVMVDQRVVESRLLEHPGHPDQKVHGRKGGGAGGVEMMPRIQAKFSSTHPAAGGGGNNPTLEHLANMGSDPGSLDTIGKVLEANGYLTDNPAARAAAAAKFGDEIRNLDFERAGLIFPNGEVYRGADGTVDTSFVPAGLQKFSKVDIHNHPSGSSISPQDVMPFDSKVGLEEVRVVSATADYSLKPSQATWGSEGQYRAAADAAYASVASNPFTTGTEKSLEFWDTVAPQMGWTMTSTGTGAPSTPKLSAIFSRLERQTSPTGLSSLYGDDDDALTSYDPSVPYGFSPTVGG